MVVVSPVLRIPMGGALPELQALHVGQGPDSSQILCQNPVDHVEESDVKSFI